MTSLFITLRAALDEKLRVRERVEIRLKLAKGLEIALVIPEGVEAHKSIVIEPSSPEPPANYTMIAAFSLVYTGVLKAKLVVTTPLLETAEGVKFVMLVNGTWVELDTSITNNTAETIVEKPGVYALIAKKVGEVKQEETKTTTTTTTPATTKTRAQQGRQTPGGQKGKQKESTTTQGHRGGGGRHPRLARTLTPMQSRQQTSQTQPQPATTTAPQEQPANTVITIAVIAAIASAATALALITRR